MATRTGKILLEDGTASIDAVLLYSCNCRRLGLGEPSGPDGSEYALAKFVRDCKLKQDEFGPFLLALIGES